MSLFELANIHFGYVGRPPILDGANLSLQAGERLCITGHNGAGKSTMLRIMVGLLKPNKGTIQAFGQSCVKDQDFYTIRQRAGLVFQDADDQLFCPTVAEDIAFGPLNQGKTPDQAMQIVTDLLQEWELGYLQDRITHKLSGGEKRLVALASVLAMQPEVLLLDEPTNALDESNEARLVEILQNLPQAMVLVSHDPHFRRKIGNRTLRLLDGKLVEPAASCRHAVA